MARSNVNIFNGTYRSLCWDEENRLMSVTDFEDGGNFSTASAYVYNAGGERVWKFAGQIERMSLNGDLYVDVAQMSSRTLYANPYLVATDQQYTKHYFIETERIASKIGGGFGMVDNPVDQYFAIAPLEGSLEDHSDNLQQHIINSFSCSANVELGAEIILRGIEDFADLDDAEEELYFTHSDHLGSSSFITDASGEAVQHLQYLPFGVPKAFGIVSQTSSSWQSRYTFSGKEKDVETGYSYFGARYYDSDISVWLSVDPMADKYPSTSSYMYVLGKPLLLIDPKGADTAFADKQARKDFNDAHNEVNNRINSVKNNISETEKKLSSNNLKKRDARKLNKDLEYSKNQLNDLNKLKSDFDEIITNDATFRYTSNTSELSALEDGAVLQSSNIFRNSDGSLSNSSIINIAIRPGELSVYIHENRHCNQIISGDVKKFPLLTLELEAFSYQSIFNPQHIVNWRQRVHNSYYGEDMGGKMPLIPLEKAIKVVYKIK